MLLIDAEDNSIQGTLRILPIPFSEKAPLYHSPDRKDNSPPGSGRTEEQIIAALVEGQQLLEQSAEGPSALLSGVKLGRIAIRTSHRGRGGGRRLLEDAEKWIIKALSETPATKGTKQVEANVELSGQVSARKFYDRYVLVLTQPRLPHRQQRVHGGGSAPPPLPEAPYRAQGVNPKIF